MVRTPRIEIEGSLYHVYNRVASGEPVFSDPEEAVKSIEKIRETKDRRSTVSAVALIWEDRLLM